MRKKSNHRGDGDIDDRLDTDGDDPDLSALDRLIKERSDPKGNEARQLT